MAPTLVPQVAFAEGRECGDRRRRERVVSEAWDDVDVEMDLDDLDDDDDADDDAADWDDTDDDD